LLGASAIDDEWKGLLKAQSRRNQHINAEKCSLWLV